MSTTGSKGWKETLQQQQTELQRLEALDANLNAANNDIDNALRRPRSASKLPARQRLLESNTRRLSAGDVDVGKLDLKDLDIGTSNERPRAAFSSVDDDALFADVALPGGNEGGGTPKAPETTIRYQRARLNILSKQIEDGQQLKKQLIDQMSDLQKQLKAEREDNKALKKRIGNLEVELKRSSSRRATDVTSAPVSTTEALQQEVVTLKKDAALAEKVAKQLDAQVKTKDVHLKRAADTIAKLQSQLNELVSQSQADTKVDSAKFTEAQSRIEVLEKQRSELLAAFKKQMKLIEVLKRQKVHVEAARLLNFTEDEFMKTLDWAS